MTHEPLPHPNGPAFVAEVVHEPSQPGYFVPRAGIVIGTGLGELAKDVGVETVGYLAVLMACVTPNGGVGPSATDVAGALGRPALLVRLRLWRLARQYWRGQPLLRVIRRPSGRETFHPTPTVLGHREVLLPRAAPQGVAPAAGSAAVVAASRAAHARPREEVERELRSVHGWPAPDELEAIADAAAKPPTDLDERWAVERLAKEKVDYSLAVKLVREYGVERCLRQLRLLPHRKGIKDKRRYIVGAIRDDYPAPGEMSDVDWTA